MEQKTKSWKKEQKKEGEIKGEEEWRNELKPQ